MILRHICAIKPHKKASSLCSPEKEYCCYASWGIRMFPFVGWELPLEFKMFSLQLMGRKQHRRTLVSGG